METDNILDDLEVLAERDYEELTEEELLRVNFIFLNDIDFSFRLKLKQ